MSNPVYLFSVKTVKYGTPTGSNTMPQSLTAIGDTVKGSVTIDESEGTVTKFHVDQKQPPVRTVKTEEGELTATMQFYDLTFANVAAIKGGHGSATGYTPAIGFTQVEKALEIELDSGHKINMFNAMCVTRITGGGGRDKMFAMEMKATPQMAADLSGSWEIKPV